MFLRNYDNYFVAVNLCVYGGNPSYPGAGSSSSSSTSVDYADGAYGQKSTNGANTGVKLSGSITSAMAYTLGPLMFDKNGICLGTGTTEVTYDDYRLSGNTLPNKLVEISSDKTYDFQTHRWKATLTASYSNTEAEAITISEWGIWRSNGSYSTTFSNSSSTCCLVFREVLDEPIVIEAGTTATLTFSVEIPMPNRS